MGTKIARLRAVSRQLLLDKTTPGYIQFLRYGVVAATSLVVDFSVLVLLKEVLNFNYIVAASISFLLGLTVNFLLSVRWVFTNRPANRTYEIVLFAIIGVVGLILTDLILALFTEGLSLNYLVSKIIATVLVYFWNFFARKYLIYTRS